VSVSDEDIHYTNWWLTLYETHNIYKYLRRYLRIAELNTTNTILFTISTIWQITRLNYMDPTALWHKRHKILDNVMQSHTETRKHYCILEPGAAEPIWQGWYTLIFYAS